jgi:hypothetical protein
LKDLQFNMRNQSVSENNHIQESHDLVCCHAGPQGRLGAQTKAVSEENGRYRFAEATRLNPALVSGDHQAQQFHDGVATMSAFKVPAGAVAWQKVIEQRN